VLYKILSHYFIVLVIPFYYMFSIAMNFVQLKLTLVGYLNKKSVLL